LAKREMLHTNSRGNCCFCTGKTFRVEGEIRLSSWQKKQRCIIMRQFIPAILSHHQIMDI